MSTTIGPPMAADTYSVDILVELMYKGMGEWVNEWNN